MAGYVGAGAEQFYSDCDAAQIDNVLRQEHIETRGWANRDDAIAGLWEDLSRVKNEVAEAAAQGDEDYDRLEKQAGLHPLLFEHFNQEVRQLRKENRALQRRLDHYDLVMESAMEAIDRRHYQWCHLCDLYFRFNEFAGHPFGGGEDDGFYCGEDDGFSFICFDCVPAEDWVRPTAPDFFYYCSQECADSGYGECCKVHTFRFSTDEDSTDTG